MPTATIDGRPVLWTPLPKQRLALECPVDDILFGGAVGGGKTDYLLADFVQHAAQYGAEAIGLLVRRTLPELRDIMKRARRMFPALGARYIASGEQARTWVFPNGASLLFGYLESDDDATRYQGQEYTWFGVDEAGAFKNPEPIDYLRSRLRCGNPSVRKKFRLTANPGGAGQAWLVERYIKPAPAYKVHVDPDSGLERVYIPSRLTDNPYLMADPSYVARIKASGPKWLVRALLMGDWNVSVAGRIFLPEYWVWREWSRPDELPAFRTIVQPWDTDFGKNRDCSASLTLGLTSTHIYVVDWLEESMKYPELKRRVKAEAALWKPSALCIEDKASGQSLIQDLQNETALPVIAMSKGALAKEDHWLKHSAFAEAGRIVLNSRDPRHHQLANFLQAAGTDAEHRDLCDALAYGLDYIREHYVFGAIDAEPAKQQLQPAKIERDSPNYKAPTTIAPQTRDFNLRQLYATLDARRR